MTKQELLAENRELKMEVQNLKFELNNLKKIIFGSASEKRNSTLDEEQLKLFDSEENDPPTPSEDEHIEVNPTWQKHP